jgi:cytidine deaminase
MVSEGAEQVPRSNMNDAQRDGLIRSALEAQKQAYCPYSDFPVGAALQTASGKIFEGVNVENASYGLTNCAERVAVGAAVAAGEREFSAIAVVSRGGVSPCGACRQVLAEFAPNLQILMVNSLNTTEVHVATLDQLLPGRFEGPQ